jgi:hypothetical protein
MAPGASRASLARKIVTLATQLENLDRQSRIALPEISDAEWRVWKADRVYGATLDALLQAVRAYNNVKAGPYPKD